MTTSKRYGPELITGKHFSFYLFLLLFLLSISVVTAQVSADEVDCEGCHAEVMKNKVVHAAVQTGCRSCHVGLDVTTVPHKVKNNTAGGLVSVIPDLCFLCHDSDAFRKKNVHKPVAEGGCLNCHDPHSSKEKKLLIHEPVMVCIECHRDVTGRPHAVTTFSGSEGHPVGLEKEEKMKDPVNKERDFYCGSCHDPHASDWQVLFRYRARSAMELCGYCHKI